MLAPVAPLLPHLLVVPPPPVVTLPRPPPRRRRRVRCFPEPSYDFAQATH